MEPSTQDPFFALDQMPHWMQALLMFLHKAPALTVLFQLMFLDMVSGFLAACKTKRLSSSVSWVGVIKKAMFLIVLAPVSYTHLTLPTILLV